MKLRKGASLALMIIVGVCAICGCDKTDTGSNVEKGITQTGVRYETREVYAMDTVMTLWAYGDNCEDALDDAVEEIERLDDIFSVGKKDSEVSIINESGSEIVSDDMATLLRTSIDVYKKTDGSFDISIYPLMVEWGFTTQNYNVPSENVIKELLNNVGADQIEINDETNFVSLPDGMEIDLGGIVKGYTSSRIMEIFEQYDLECGLVSLGGNVQVYKRKTDGSDWSIGIENPTAGEDYIGIIKSHDIAVITSGDYERYFEKDGKRYHHILDPKTGKPSESGLTSVTIVCSDGTTADALSTALYVMGKDKAIKFWEQYGNAMDFQVVFVEKDGSITITGGLEDNFSSSFEYTIVS